MTESTLALVAFGAFIAALAIIGLIRLAPGMPFEKYQLDELETAYLFGGEKRAKEMAFFFLLRDGCIKGDPEGNFHSRYDALPDELSQTHPKLSCELLEKIIASRGANTATLRGYKLASLEGIERRLEKRRLMLSKRQFDVCALAARLPLGAISLVALKMSGEGLIRQQTPIAAIAITISCWIAIQLLNHHLSPRTEAGEKLYEHLRENLKSKSKSKRDEDRLSILQDELLAKGLGSMVGAAILPTKSGLSA